MNSVLVALVFLFLDFLVFAVVNLASRIGIHSHFPLESIEDEQPMPSLRIAQALDDCIDDDGPCSGEFGRVSNRSTERVAVLIHAVDLQLDRDLAKKVQSGIVSSVKCRPKQLASFLVAPTFDGMGVEPAPNQGCFPCAAKVGDTQKAILWIRVSHQPLIELFFLVSWD